MREIAVVVAVTLVAALVALPGYFEHKNRAAPAACTCSACGSAPGAPGRTPLLLTGGRPR